VPPGVDVPRIFLCHSKADRLTVRDLYNRLRTDGFHPWIEEEDILPGQDWNHIIRQAIKSSRYVLVCLSASSIGKPGYVQKEIRAALDVAEEYPEGSIYLIPVRLEPCDIPSGLGRFQWVDLFEPVAYHKLLKALRK
jgi:hypothetical protein